jgi:peroxiredoxin (alkyl hydroperoxide reductase subunit C)
VGDEVMEVTQELLKGKTVLLFGVPGAFTPTCSNEHLPSYVKSYAELKAKGIDMIACLSVNDVFVQMGWAKSAHAEDKVIFLSDWDAEVVKSLGMDIDLSAHGLGIRSQRFAMVIKDGVVTHLHQETSPSACTITKGESLLQEL